MMQCPSCQAVLTLRYKYRVLGKRYNNLPGVIRVYWCPACQQKIRCCEVLERRLQEWDQMWERARQDWILEKAALEQKIYWLKQPADNGAQKLQQLRANLIHLIEQTF
jgi:hypothetical protein